MSETPQSSKLEDDVSADIFEAIGKLFMVAAACENILSIHILRLLNHPSPGLAMPLLGGMELNVKVSLIRIMGAARVDKESAKILGKTCDTIRDAFKNRHLLAHSIAKAGPTADSILVQSTRYESDGSFPKPRQMTATEIRGWTRKIHDSLRLLDGVLTIAGVPRLDPPS